MVDLVRKAYRLMVPRCKRRLWQTIKRIPKSQIWLRWYPFRREAQNDFLCESNPTHFFPERQKSICLQRLRESQKALQTFKRINAVGRPLRPSISLAYRRYLNLWNVHRIWKKRYGTFLLQKSDWNNCRLFSVFSAPRLLFLLSCRQKAQTTMIMI